MADPIASVSMSPSTQRSQGLDGLVSELGTKMEAYERKLKDDLAGVLAPDGSLMTLPDPIRKQFAEWDRTYTQPQDIEMKNAIKRKIMEMHDVNQTYIRDKVENKASNLRLELSMKAINKSMSSIQQLLSAQ